MTKIKFLLKEVYKATTHAARHFSSTPPIVGISYPSFVAMVSQYHLATTPSVIKKSAEEVRRDLFGTSKKPKNPLELDEILNWYEYCEKVEGGEESLMEEISAHMNSLPLKEQNKVKAFILLSRSIPPTKFLAPSTPKSYVEKTTQEKHEKETYHPQAVS